MKAAGCGEWTWRPGKRRGMSEIMKGVEQRKKE